MNLPEVVDETVVHSVEEVSGTVLDYQSVVWQLVPSTCHSGPRIVAVGPRIVALVDFLMPPQTIRATVQITVPRETLPVLGTITIIREINQVIGMGTVGFWSSRCCNQHLIFVNIAMQTLTSRRRGMVGVRGGRSIWNQCLRTGGRTSGTHMGRSWPAMGPRSLVSLRWIRDLGYIPSGISPHCSTPRRRSSSRSRGIALPRWTGTGKRDPESIGQLEGSISPPTPKLFLLTYSQRRKRRKSQL